MTDESYQKLDSIKPLRLIGNIYPHPNAVFIAHLFSIISIYVGHTCISPFLPGLLSKADVASTWTGLIFCAYPLAQAFVSFAAGKIIQKYGPEWTHFLSLICVVIGHTLFSMCSLSNPILLICSRIIAGGASALTINAGYVITSRLFINSLNLRVAIIEVCIGAASAFGDIVGGYLFETYGWYMTFFALISFQAIGCLFSLICFKNIPFPFVFFKRNNTNNITNLNSNNNANYLNDEKNNTEEEIDNIVSISELLLGSPRCFIVFSIALTASSAYTFYDPVLAPHLEESFGPVSESTVGLVLAFVSGVYTLATLIAGAVLEDPAGDWSDDPLVEGEILLDAAEELAREAQLILSQQGLVVHPTGGVASNNPGIMGSNIGGAPSSIAAANQTNNNIVAHQSLSMRTLSKVVPEVNTAQNTPTLMTNHADALTHATSPISNAANNSNISQTPTPVANISSILPPSERPCEPSMEDLDTYIASLPLPPKSFSLAAVIGLALIAVGFQLVGPVMHHLPEGYVSLLGGVEPHTRGGWLTTLIGCSLTATGNAISFVPTVSWMQLTALRSFPLRRSQEVAVGSVVAAMALGEAIAPLVSSRLVDDYGFSEATNFYSLPFVAMFVIAVLDLIIPNKISAGQAAAGGWSSSFKTHEKRKLFSTTPASRQRFTPHAALLSAQLLKSHHSLMSGRDRFGGRSAWGGSGIRFDNNNVLNSKTILSLVGSRGVHHQQHFHHHHGDGGRNMPYWINSQQFQQQLSQTGRSGIHQLLASNYAKYNQLGLGDSHHLNIQNNNSIQHSNNYAANFAGGGAFSMSGWGPASSRGGGGGGGGLQHGDGYWFGSVGNLNQLFQIGSQSGYGNLNSLQQQQQQVGQGSYYQQQPSQWNVATEGGVSLTAGGGGTFDVNNVYNNIQNNQQQLMMNKTGGGALSAEQHEVMELAFALNQAALAAAEEGVELTRLNDEERLARLQSRRILRSTTMGARSVQGVSLNVGSLRRIGSHSHLQQQPHGFTNNEGNNNYYF